MGSYKINIRLKDEFDQPVGDPIVTLFEDGGLQCGSAGIAAGYAQREASAVSGWAGGTYGCVGEAVALP